jgi:hypothetical protein
MCNKWFLKYVVVRKAEETRKRGIRRKQLLDDLKNRRRYWNLKKEALNCILGRTGFGRG